MRNKVTSSQKGDTKPLTRNGPLSHYATVLGLLEAREDHGFSLLQRAKKKEGVIFSEGTLYPLPTKMEKQGFVRLVREVRAPGIKGGRPARVYAITEDGKTALLDALRIIQNIFFPG